MDPTVAVEIVAAGTVEVEVDFWQTDEQLLPWELTEATHLGVPQKQVIYNEGKRD